MASSILSIEGRCEGDGGRFARRRIEIDHQAGGSFVWTHFH
jgi:hypothetical protein